MRTRQEYIDLLKETVDFYSEDTSRRAVDGRNCYYRGPDGNRCAVGRCMSDRAIEDYGHVPGSLTNLIRHSPHDTLDPLLQEKYQGYGRWFWSRLQTLHDCDPFWAQSGLSIEGQKEIKDILADTFERSPQSLTYLL